MRSARRHVAAHVLALLALVAALYANSLDVPFMHDDKLLIADNPLIRDPRVLVDLDRARGYPEFSHFLRRYVSYATFIANYAEGGLDVRNYHVANVAIHGVSTLLVYALAVLLMGAPRLAGSRYDTCRRGIALAAAAIFAAHPLATDAVTYLMQRFALLAAAFYLAAVVSYLMARREGRRPVRWAFLGLSALCVLLAVKSKENAITAPVAIALVEAAFLGGPWRRRAMYSAIPFIPLLIVPATMMAVGIPLIGEASLGAASASHFDRDYARLLDVRWEYLQTQQRVIVSYFRLLLLPLNQTLEYDYPPLLSMWDARVLGPMALHAALVMGAMAGLWRTRNGGSPPVAIAAFGVLWFYLGLAVESSLLPIPMLLCEYRLYLPMAGPIIALAAAGAYVWDDREAARAPLLIALAALLALFSCLTVLRNRVWQSPVILWEDAVRKAPQKARAHNNLATAYNEALRYDEALDHLVTAALLAPDNTSARFNLGMAYLGRGDHARARREFEHVLRIEPGHGQALLFLRYAEGQPR